MSDKCQCQKYFFFTWAMLLIAGAVVVAILYSKISDTETICQDTETISQETKTICEETNGMYKTSYVLYNEAKNVWESWFLSRLVLNGCFSHLNDDHEKTYFTKITASFFGTVHAHMLLNGINQLETALYGQKKLLTTFKNLFIMQVLQGNGKDLVNATNSYSEYYSFIQFLREELKIDVNTGTKPAECLFDLIDYSLPALSE